MNLKKYALHGSAVAASLTLALTMLATSTAGVANAAVTVIRADNVAVTTAPTGSPVTGTLTMTPSELTSAVTSELVFTLPGGFAFVGTPTLSVSTLGTLAFAAGVVTPSVAGGAQASVVFDVTTGNTSVSTVAFNAVVRNGGPAAGGATGGASGAITVTGDEVAPTIADFGMLTAAYVGPFTITMTTIPVVSSVAADGSQSVTVNATVVDANAVPVAGKPVNWSTSIGYLGTGTSKTALSTTSTAGIAQQSYRGAGNVAATDSIIASSAAPSGVNTLSMPLTVVSSSTGTFAYAPVYSANKLAQVVFMGGTVVQLDAALVAHNGGGAWAQNAQGVYILYIVNGGFVNDSFKAAFPNGLPNPIALTVVSK